MNAKLRNRSTLTKEQQAQVDALDAAIRKTPALAEDTVVYRAVPKHILTEGHRSGRVQGDVEVGAEFTDLGYVSTSTERASVNDPGYVHPNDRMVMHIRVPKGTKALAPSAFTKGNEKANALATWENERLLGRGQRFRIDKIDGRDLHVSLVGLRTLKSRDPLSEAASAWAKKHTAELVTGIAETTRKRIAAVVAKQLPDKKTHTALVQILKDPQRVQLIARTEAMIAAHQGQRLVWAQAVEDGLLDADFKRRWIFTDDEVGCPQCEALDGQLAEAEGEYEPGVASPPAHPNCRCTEGLVP